MIKISNKCEIRNRNKIFWAYTLFCECYKDFKTSGMIDVTFYQFILADNNQTMQFCPVFLYFSKSGFNVEYFTFILSRGDRS